MAKLLLPDMTSAVDPFLLAGRWGLTLHPRDRRRAYLRGTHLYYDGKLSVERQRALITMQLARYASDATKAACRSPRKCVSATPEGVARRRAASA